MYAGMDGFPSRRHKKGHYVIPYYTYPMAFCPWFNTCPMKHCCDMAQMYPERKNMREEGRYGMCYDFDWSPHEQNHD